MKNKLSWQLVVIAAHFFTCLFLSFPWGFLEGMYLGFLATFFILWGSSLPALTACIGVVAALCKRKRENTVIVILSGLILLCYVASAVGLLKNVALNFVYIGVVVLTASIWIIVAVRWLRRRKKKSII